MTTEPSTAVDYRPGPDGEALYVWHEGEIQIDESESGSIGKVAQDEEGGHGRSGTAERFWQAHWHEMFPASGKGRFVYHHHWRGLGEDETGLSEKELLDTAHSLHGDLRFEATPQQNWGFSVFLGTTEDNRKAGGDRLTVLPPDDKLQGSFKLPQPHSWLDVGVGKPLISEPGGAGASSDKYAKFIVLDHGDYDVGVWREHAQEIFLHGGKLKGRFLLQFAPVGGGRVWLLSRPVDQTPYAESHKMEDVLAELKQKHQPFLIWHNPNEGGRPRKIDVARGTVAKECYAEILKADNERQLVYGVVLEPNTVDTQGDIAAPDEIEAAAHRFLVESRKVGEQHKKKARAEVVESYIAPTDFLMNKQPVKAGTWVMVIHVSDPVLWRGVKDGRYTGFSIGGTALREAAQ